MAQSAADQGDEVRRLAADGAVDESWSEADALGEASVDEAGTEATEEEEEEEKEEEEDIEAPPASTVASQAMAYATEYNRPLVFLALVSVATPVRNLFRVVASYTTSNTDASGSSSPTGGGGAAAVLKKGAPTFPYPDTPQWMTQARAGIPQPMVAVATTLLNGLGIPTFQQLREMQYRKALQALEDSIEGCGNHTTAGDAAGGTDAANGGEDSAASSSSGTLFFVPLPLAFMLSGLAIVLSAKYVIATRCQAIRQRQRQQELLRDDSRGLEDILYDNPPPPPMGGTAAAAASGEHPPLAYDDGTAPAPHTPRPGSAHSSEPTHGQRLRDVHRTTPRMTFQREQDRAARVADALAGQSTPRGGDGGGQQPPVQLLMSHLASPPPHAPSLAGSSSHQQSVQPSHSRSLLNLSGMAGLAGASTGEAILAFAAPAPLTVVQSMLTMASKNRCRRVIVARSPEDFSSLQVADSVQLIVVDDVRSYVKFLGSTDRSLEAADDAAGVPPQVFTSVAVLDRKTSRSCDMFPFMHPANVVYIVAPPQTTVDLSWCDAQLHVLQERSPSTFVGMLSVVLFDRSKKEGRRATSVPM
jgi:hypothetical protein